MQSERLGAKQVKREPSTQQRAGPAEMASNPTSTSLHSGETQQAGTQRATSSRYRTAESREKNRQAQQRFRDRQKAVLEGREAQAAGIRAEAERVRRANLQLAESARIKEKVLAVREAMLSALEPAPQPPPQQPLPWQAAAAAGLLSALQQQQAAQQQQQHWQWQAAAAALQQQQQQQQPPGALLGHMPLHMPPQLQQPQPLQFPQQGGWAGEQLRGGGGGPRGGLQYYSALQPAQQQHHHHQNQLPRAQQQPPTLPQPPSALELMLQQAWQEQAALAEGLLQQCQAAGAAAAVGLGGPLPGATGAALPALSSTAPGALAAAAAAVAAAGMSPQSVPASVGTLPSLQAPEGTCTEEGRLQEEEHSPQQQQQQQQQRGQREQQWRQRAGAEQGARGADGSAAEGSGAGVGSEWAPAASTADEVVEELQAIQLPEFDDPVRRELVEGMHCPEDFMEAWRVWQVELGHSLSEAEASGFRGQEMRKLDDIVDHMVILFWYASRLKPGYAEACMVQGGAPPEIAEELYRRVASLIQLSSSQRAKLLKQWNLCSKRLAQAEVSIQRWSAVLHAEHEKAADAAASTAATRRAGQGEDAGGAAAAAGVAAALAAVGRKDSGGWQQQLEQGVGLSGAAAAAAEAAAALAGAEVVMTEAGEEGPAAAAAAAAAAGSGGGGGNAAPKGMLGSDSRGMVATARSSLAVSEATAKLAQACKAKDLAVKDFLGKLNWVFSTEVKARINVLSAPYFPDFLSISRHLLFPGGGGCGGGPSANGGGA